eukprot:6173247-Pleurochrysis_carterae.AAC.5
MPIKLVLSKDDDEDSMLTSSVKKSQRAQVKADCHMRCHVSCGPHPYGAPLQPWRYEARRKSALLASKQYITGKNK